MLCPGGRAGRSIRWQLMRYVVSLAVFLLLTSPLADAAPLRPHRGIHRCGVVSPTFAQKAAIEARLAASAVETSAAKPALISVPVAFHVIQSSAGDNAATEAQIRSQMSRLNAAFKNVVRFHTALIETVVNDRWFSAQVGSAEDAEMRAELRVGDARTLNIYLAEPYLDEPGDLLGVAQFPWEYARFPEQDGVVIRHTTLPGGSFTPYNKGKTMVHEVGHWLGLLHTFEPPNPFANNSSSNNGCRGKGDRVSDTPAEKLPHYACRQTDSCPQAGLDPIRNFMNYTDDTCLRSFSEKQRTRIRSMFRSYRRGA